MSYHQFRDDEGNAYGSFEVFRIDRIAQRSDDEQRAPGWYWWACFPGCMPDGDACGPFETEQAAIDDAQGC